ncbi:MAG TPA: DNA glycosylase [Lacunisphaera sp.]|nr:DNA glycosylase [Lacunisphaera sp.]
MTSRGKVVSWSDWQPLPGWNPPPPVLAETLDGGQSFRWSPVSIPATGAGGETGVHRLWTGTWSDHLVQIRLKDAALEWRGTGPSAEAAVTRYLALDSDWAALTDSLPWWSDLHLAQCIAAFPGLRILRQPFGETLLGFLCSATKQIVQIKQMVALLAQRHGSPLVERGDRNAFSDAGVSAAHLRQLPTWEQLASIPEKDLRACLLGFRARYIHQTARFLAARPGWLEATEHLPYLAAKTRLLELPGVGEKVADCVLLFGAGKLEAFPVDTWVLRSLARRYGLEGWKPAQVAHFGRTHFGPLAGLAQQYLFAWERKFGGR